MQPDFGCEHTIQRNLHRVGTGDIQRKIDHRDDRQVHLESRIGPRRNVQLTIRRPECLEIRIYPCKAEVVRAGVLHRSLETNHEMSARMNCRECADGYCVKHSEDVQLSLLREICSVSEYGKRNVHCVKVEASALSC